MCPPSVSVLADIDVDRTAEELFLSLEKLSQGYPPPGNVITDVNPYNHDPSNLPYGIWYYIHSKESTDMELGSWKIKGEACKLFSNSFLTGWKTTLEFFEGGVLQERKTDWVMEDYWINHKAALGENSKRKVSGSLCRVFLIGEKGLDYRQQWETTSSKIVNEPFPFLTESTAPNIHGVTRNSSSNKNEEDGEAKEMAVTGETSNHMVENLPEADYISGGDYLELLDLDNPASPSSSSDNSSCLTMSSDEYFDSLALLRDIESNNNQGLTVKDENSRSNVSATLGTNYRDEGPSNYVAGSASDGEKKKKKKKTSKDKMKKPKKYLCFMPFNFLF